MGEAGEARDDISVLDGVADIALDSLSRIPFEFGGEVLEKFNAAFLIHQALGMLSLIHI